MGYLLTINILIKIYKQINCHLFYLFSSQYDGASWCFLGKKNNDCIDKTASSSLPGTYWSTDACYTPLKTSSKCSVIDHTIAVDIKDDDMSCATTR